MSDLRELYQEIILDHNKQPRNCHELTDASNKAHGNNPLCGDKVTVYLKVTAGRIEDISFKGSGCAISTASASLMTEALKGKTVDEAQKLFESFHEVITSASSEATAAEKLGKLAVFSGVAEFPLRVKCAALAWHTLQAALHEKKSSDVPVVSTES